MSILHLLIKASKRSMPRVSRGVHQVDPLMRKDAQFKLHALPLLLTTLTGAVRSFGAPIFSSVRCTVAAALCPSLRQVNYSCRDSRMLVTSRSSEPIPAFTEEVK